MPKEKRGSTKKFKAETKLAGQDTKVQEKGAK